jgi:hypothetical protein
VVSALVLPVTLGTASEPRAFGEFPVVVVRASTFGSAATRFSARPAQGALMADDPTPPDADAEGTAGEDEADPPVDGPPDTEPATDETDETDGTDTTGVADEAEEADAGEGAGDATAEEADEIAASETPAGDADADGAGVEAETANGGDETDETTTDETDETTTDEVPDDVRKYERFKKVDGAQYDRVNDFLRERTYVTAREWAIARLCADFRTETGVEMTKIGENLDELVPFMEDTYSPQAVNQARSSFEEKVHKAGATFLYGAMSDFFTAEELDELMYEVTEVAKFLLEVEGVDLSVEEELAAEDRISGVMREVREASEALRYEECPHCGEQLRE